MKRMLFNATQSEEIRVAIVDGQKLVDLDIELLGKEQKKGDVYKGVISKVEVALDAAFVNYGAERHGFLPFKEISRIYLKEDRNARIQDVLKEGQELIVQVEKDERGNKGASLTTFVSLAGRYLVLMPNNPRGGGISRRIDGEVRNELRDALSSLNVPNGMSLIARTAGIGKSVEELEWDLNYLRHLWEAIDGAAKNQKGAFLIYQERSLVIRAIRDYFQPDIDEILIDTEEVYDQALQFMNHVMPNNVSRVKLYRDDVPLFSRFQIENQIETAFAREVMLPSGGAIVIDHTEALVSIDVNSGKSTKGRDIENTAYHTNLEAVDEIARQLKLRDLGGLIVIDFIDMEDTAHQRSVESRLQDAIHGDRARVQLSKISTFGLLELSRQRLRPSLGESNHVVCPRCIGTGRIRNVESSALHILRLIQEEAIKRRSRYIQVQLPIDSATYLLNEKRIEIQKIEETTSVSIFLIPNSHMESPNYNIIRVKQDGSTEETINKSYNLVEVPVEATSLREDPKETTQKAVVQGVHLSESAPIINEKSLLNKIKDIKDTIVTELVKIFGEKKEKENVSSHYRARGGRKMNNQHSSTRNNERKTEDSSSIGRGVETTNEKFDRQKRGGPATANSRLADDGDSRNRRSKNRDQNRDQNREQRFDRNQRQQEISRSPSPLRQGRNEVPIAPTTQNDANLSTEKPAEIGIETSSSSERIKKNQTPIPSEAVVSSKKPFVFEVDLSQIQVVETSIRADNKNLDPVVEEKDNELPRPKSQWQARMPEHLPVESLVIVQTKSDLDSH